MAFNRDRMECLRDVRRTLSVFDAFEEVRDVIDTIDIVSCNRHRIVYRRMVRWLCCYRTIPLSTIDTGKARKLRGHVLAALGSIGSVVDINAKDIERLGAQLDGILRAHQRSADGSLRDTAVYSITAAECWRGITKGKPASVRTCKSNCDRSQASRL